MKALGLPELPQSQAVSSPWDSLPALLCLAACMWKGGAGGERLTHRLASGPVHCVGSGVRHTWVQIWLKTQLGKMRQVTAQLPHPQQQREQAGVWGAHFVPGALLSPLRRSWHLSLGTSRGGVMKRV